MSALELSSGRIVVGYVAGAFGVKGWVKVKSFTQPKENMLSYSPWYAVAKSQPSGSTAIQQLARNGHGGSGKETTLSVIEASVRPQGIVVRLEGVNDREAAEALKGLQLEVETAALPSLEGEEFYWHQLIGLDVVTLSGDQKVKLGQVKGLMETGANDVLVVKANASDVDSLDRRERLIPYVPGTFVSKVDIESKVIEVDWDPEF